MKEKYISAEIEAVNLLVADIITTSGVPDNFGDGNNHNSDGWNTN